MKSFQIALPVYLYSQNNYLERMDQTAIFASAEQYTSLRKKISTGKCIWRDYNIIKKVGCNVMELNVKKVKDNGGKENE